MGDFICKSKPRVQVVEMKFSSVSFDSYWKLFGSFPASWLKYWRCIAHDLSEFTILGYTAQRGEFQIFLNIP